MRRSPRLPALLLIALLAAAPAGAHMGQAKAATPPPAAQSASQPPPPQIRSVPLAEGAWCIYGMGGNIGAVASSDAVLLVDSQFADVAPAILAEVRKLKDAPLRWLVNTHHHFDHTGGNRAFAAAGAAVVGHQNVRRHLLEDQAWAKENLPARIEALEGAIGGLATGQPLTKGALEGRLGLYRTFMRVVEGTKPEEIVAPAITFDDRMKVWLGDEEIEIFHVAPAHTDGDAIVYFPKRHVIHMGDTFVNATFPFLDLDGGGGTEGWLKTLDAVIAVLPEGTRVVPGHGEAAGVPELKRFRAYMADLREAVGAARAAGKTLEQALGAIKMTAYADWKPGFQSLTTNIDMVWREMGGTP